MKICFLDDEPEIYPLQYGGKARTITNLAKYLINNHLAEVTIASRSINIKEKKAVIDGINYIRLEGYGLMRQILDEISRSDVTSIHSCSFTVPLLKNLDTKIFYNLHDVIFTTIDAGSHLDKAVTNYWSGIISPSSYAENVFKNVNWWNNGSSKICTIPRGIHFDNVNYFDEEKFCKKFEKIYGLNINKYFPVIFFPNRAKALKGEEYFEAIISGLKAKKLNPLIISTNVPITKKERILNIGWAKEEELVALYQRSDLVLILSTLPESFSQVALESIYFKKPVVSFGFGNIACLAKEFNLIFLTEPDSDNIVGKILEAIEVEPSTAKKNQRAVKESYSLNAMGKNTFSLYKKAPKNKYIDYKNVANFSKEDYRYFINPSAWIFNEEVVFLVEEGKVIRICLKITEMSLLKYLQVAKTISEIKIQNFSLSSLKELVNKGLIIRG